MEECPDAIPRGIAMNWGGNIIAAEQVPRRIPDNDEVWLANHSHSECNARSRVATGFWNPFHHCFDAFGNLFVVDNDPDSRGPCR